MRRPMFCIPPLSGALLGALLAAASCASSGAPTRSRPGIVPGPTMRLAGTHTFAVHPAGAGREVRWRVDRVVRDTSGAELRSAALLEATGRRATFPLEARPGGETLYLIRATGAEFSDSVLVQVFPAGVRSYFTHRSAGNPPVRSYVTVPPTLGPRTRVVMVMHGNSRNASGYADSWVDWAASHDYIALTPHFTQADWPGSRGYNVGNMLAGETSGERLPASRWSFTLVEGIFERVRSGFRLSVDRYDLWGHSAGGQFVHRLMLFLPQARVRVAIAANSGWYTVPDTAVTFPYGARSPSHPIRREDLVAWTGRRMIIMRGTADTLRDEDLRTTPEAERQGPTRYARAGHMLEQARRLNPRTRWEIVDVPGAGHSQGQMAPAAQRMLERLFGGGTGAR